MKPTDPHRIAAELYPKKLDRTRRRYLLTKPFAETPWGDDACGKLHDLAAIVELLRLPAGAAILEIGCGSGWLCEMLARLGYRTMGLDVSREMIRLARRRVRRVPFRPLFQPIPADFAVADAEDFDLGRRFDAIILYDALHHFADERAVLRCARAHLVAGGKVFLKEPPEDHVHAPETRGEVETFGVLERGFSRDQLLAALAEAGFEPPVFLRQASILMDERRFAAGVGRAIGAAPAHHLVLALNPGGAHDSRLPGALRAHLAVTGSTGPCRPGERLRLEVRARNTGDTTWLSTPHDEGGFVRLGAQIRDESGQLVTDAACWTNLASDVPPGGETTLEAVVTVPDRPGRHLLRIDLVDEGITWFADAGSVPSEHELVVAAT